MTGQTANVGYGPDERCQNSRGNGQRSSPPRARFVGWPAGRHATPFCGCGASTLSSEFLNDLREWLSDAVLRFQGSRVWAGGGSGSLARYSGRGLGGGLPRFPHKTLAPTLSRNTGRGSKCRMQLPYPFLKIPASLIVLPSNVR